MARIRSIHPSACTSEKMAQLSPEAERCFWRLQTHCDDLGRCENNARLINAALFPLNDDTSPGMVELWVKEMERVGLIVLYEVDGRRYLQVVGFDKFQKPRHPSPSKIPGPPEDYGVSPEAYRQAPHGEGVGDGDGGGGADAGKPARTRGTRIPDEFTVTPEMIEWVEDNCPRLDWRKHTQRFVNYWKAKAGKEAVKLDWERTWQNWMLKESD